MLQLLLLRHAKSSWDDAELSDHARPLNARGERAAATMGRAMREAGLNPDVVLVSTARRAQQTLEALEPWDETPRIDSDDALYLASPMQLLAALRKLPKTARSVLLIGHNPGLQEFALMLHGEGGDRPAGSPIARLSAAYPTAALAEFAVPGAWGELEAGGAQLLRFLLPRDVARGR
ncbi:MAG: histidine phosphatase family protein [Acetobacteraceae bacterium]|nr:histidine phosphatase family protein [Acetobacteraceae bacterium]